MKMMFESIIAVGFKDGRCVQLVHEKPDCEIVLERRRCGYG